MAPIADAVAGSEFASSITVELIGLAGKEAISKGGDWLLVDKPLDILIGNHAHVLTTTSVKTLLITLKYKHIIDDAALGFFRSPVHSDPSMFSNVADYFAVEKGWFSPYLFATNRRPVVPRTMKADVIFAHGPFLSGDYEVAETLLAHSTIVLHFCVPPPPRQPQPEEKPIEDAINTAKATLSAVLPDKDKDKNSSRTPSPEPDAHRSTSAYLEAQYKRFSKKLFHSKDAPPAGPPSDPTNESKPAEVSAPQSALPSGVDVTDINPLAKPTEGSGPPPRRMIILLLGLKPHRAGIWTSSARPSESVIHYLLLNGCPTIVVPVKPGSPLVAWDTLTLTQLQKYAKEGRRSEGVIRILFEYVSLCVDWDRVILPQGGESEGAITSGEVKETPVEGLAADETGETGGSSADEEKKKKSLKDALEVLVTAAMKTVDSKEVKDKVDPDRAGIAFFRLP
ncbi:hypothetical protein FRC00_010996 [Tulasnella sp. 408]|nr:hypothetical protein FRC00_010996 [Tulasnella sp. 408]